jgi:hypothetical protein
MAPICFDPKSRRAPMALRITRDGIELMGAAARADCRRAVAAEVSRIAVELERVLAPRDGRYVPQTTVNFDSDGRICTVVDEGSRTILIHIPLSCMEADPASLYQRSLNLSHELAHTLTPCGEPGRATLLDEGLAVFFAEAYTGRPSRPPRRYREARDLVRMLLATDNGVVRRLRARHPGKRICDYTAPDILGEVPALDPSVADDLVRRFYCASSRGTRLTCR